MEIGIGGLSLATEFQGPLMDVIFIAQIEGDSVTEALLHGEAAAHRPEGRQAFVAGEVFERNLGSIERSAGMRGNGFVEQEVRGVKIRRRLRVITNVRGQ